MIDERGFLHRLARIETRLLPEARQRADQRRLPPACAQLQHQAAEPVAFSLSCPGGDDRFFERPCDVAEDEIGATRIIDHELVYPILCIPADGPGGIAILDQRLEAHVLQARNLLPPRHSLLAILNLTIIR